MRVAFLASTPSRSVFFPLRLDFNSLSISMFHNINSVDACGATFHNICRDQINADQVNFNISHTTTGAIQHNSCVFIEYTHLHLGTRQEVTGKIIEWIDGGSDQPVCWLNGAAGAGKSAISRTVARLCDGSNRLCASFFFFRGAGH
ncbi:hypothetical protein PILCRDRAFT_80508 [Piloderma croceum F 1598]|uniref:Nephrocystin 3-like N-terminal domain-containing protein n=1 Tax=Piloderma croceum (strain F 1598) TaxID=765440 RepID=A0A0C3F1C2_PILCF|nr:hypothetical protein PILCRDRAFT_80508 [Piloderma croceum F 1598]